MPWTHLRAHDQRFLQSWECHFRIYPEVCIHQPYQWLLATPEITGIISSYKLMSITDLWGQEVTPDLNRFRRYGTSSIDRKLPALFSRAHYEVIPPSRDIFFSISMGSMVPLTLEAWWLQPWYLEDHLGFITSSCPSSGCAACTHN